MGGPAPARGRAHAGHAGPVLGPHSSGPAGDVDGAARLHTQGLRVAYLPGQVEGLTLHRAFAPQHGQQASQRQPARKVVSTAALAAALGQQELQELQLHPSGRPLPKEARAAQAKKRTGDRLVDPAAAGIRLCADGCKASGGA